MGRYSSQYDHGYPEEFLTFPFRVRKPCKRQVASALREGGENMQGQEKVEVPVGFMLIFRASKHDKDGNVLYAKDYGLRGWPLVVPRKKQ